MKFSKVETRPSFPELEKSVLDRWNKEKTFQASLERTKDGKEYIFYDGPPFPTGNPHHGTLFVSVLKDVIPRYKTMQGHYVPRVWGWDCHGLPIETQAEKNLEITNKIQIEESIGVKAFNDECRSIVSNFNESWKTYIDRAGRWVDMEQPYQTMDLDFMESVIWSFAECYKRGLIYKDYRVNPYCYRCETPLSVSDTRSDDATRPRQDRTVTAKCKVNELEDTYFLIWTTTPWTLPSNLAVAVGEEIVYSFVESGDSTYVIADKLVQSFAKELGEHSVTQQMTGAELIAKNYTYTPVFPYFADENPNGFRLLKGDFVTTEDGTGLVHMAPAFGEDDYWLCREHGIEVKSPVNDQGRFTEKVSDFEGQNVHEANSDIIRHLKQQGLVFRDQTIEHNYPHCWRCRTPLIYRALDAWYFNVEEVKSRLIENNKEINWYPSNVGDGRFGKWLENARDWNISRNRYWATPIPVWKCSDCDELEVLGTLEEINEKAGRELNDLHKEYLDEVKFPCKSCGGEMERTPEVLDGWWESGSMPYGQFHYPFKNAEHFRSHFPADFIVEYTGQIRCWFYYLHVLSTALFDKPAFSNCLVHGTLLAADGKKISKSQKNYTDPLELMDKYGADAVRAYLLSAAAVQMADLSFRDDGVEGMVRSISLPLWNALSFLTTYAEIDEISTEDLDGDLDSFELNELDRYILSETELFVRSTTEYMERYAVHEACRLIPEFLDTLNNWYIRRSRSRVWEADKEAPSKLAFFATLYRVLSRFTQVYAPFCPFLAETVWEKLQKPESVHLSSWPEVEEKWIDEELSRDFAAVRSAISAGLAIRAREQIRVRQPLASASVAYSGSSDLGQYAQIICDELNLKDLEVLPDTGAIAEKIGKPNGKLIGPKYGKAVQEIIRLAKSGEFEELADGKVQVGDYTLEPEEIEIAFVGRPGMQVESMKGGVIALNVEITPELELEGRARDLVRQIQDLRKEADLEISDRIALQVSGADDIMAVHSEYVLRETLSVKREETIQDPAIARDVSIEKQTVSLALKVHSA